MNAPIKPIDLSTASKAPTDGHQEVRKPGQQRVALLGLFGCGNFGNDGSLEAMLNFLRKAHPQAELVCICADPQLITARYGIAAVPISSTYAPALRAPASRLRKLGAKLEDLYATLKHLRGTDLVIVPGTGILDDFGERLYGMPWDILRWCLGARLLGAKLAFVSIGAGPIHHRLSRQLMKSAARLAHYRSYRDTLSQDFMTRIGFKAAGDPIYPDIAFGLPFPQPVDRADSGRLNVGIGVMSYFGWYGFADGGRQIYDRYIDKLTQFAAYVLDQGHTIRLLAGETSDAGAIEDLRQRLSAARPQAARDHVVNETAGSLHDIMRQISTTDIVVTTRFHNLVCALKLGRPTISLGYSKKNDYLMQQAGLADFCDHVEQFEVDTLIQRFEKMRATAAECAQRVDANNIVIDAQLKAQEAAISSAFLGVERRVR